MSLLVLNAGSTSLKFEVFDDGARENVASGSVAWSDGDRAPAQFTLREAGQAAECFAVSAPDHRAAAALAFEKLAQRHAMRAVGHRVVHGGARFRESTRVDEAVKAELRRLCALAPLHNPPALSAIEAAESALTGVPQVAVFDTAFFATLPERAWRYPVPYEWHERFGIRRFGFHGISNAWCARRAAEMLGGDPAALRLVTCHLGGGSSATAVKAGRAVATSMGFSPMEGLMMTTRSGSIDPGVMLHLLRDGAVTAAELDRALNQESGLLGVSGVAPQLSAIEAAAQSGNARAQLAFEMFADRVRAAIGALAVQMGGLDVLVLTGGVSEVSAPLRAEICRGLECLGVRLDPPLNASGQPDMDLAAKDSTARVLLLRTREELLIARETRLVAGLL